MTLLAQLDDFEDVPKGQLQQSLNTTSDDELSEVLMTVSISDHYSDECRAWLYKEASRRVELGAGMILWIKKALIESDDWKVILNLLQADDHVFEASVFQRPENQHLFYNRFHFLLTHENKMINAWAYHGLIRLAYFNEDFKEPVLQMVHLAQQDGTGSIIARLRNSLKTYPLSHES